MAETALRIIGVLVGALVRGLFDYLLIRTGCWTLAICGIRSNIFAQALAGIFTWVTFGLSALVIAAGVMNLSRLVHL